MKALLLAAGLGTRLLPLTKSWPKCLMPIHGRPLLEYWLGILKRQEIKDVLINIHHHSELVEEFLDQAQYKKWVEMTFESDLLGTAGTLRQNSEFFKQDTTLMVHADNWSCCNYADFISYHQESRPEGTVMTMMTFDSLIPETCGIVELDSQNRVIEFHEKVKNPPGKLANAAVYLIEPEVLEWIEEHPVISDFSTEVLPHFIGKIATWNNNHIHKDIGTIEMLKKAQQDNCEAPPWDIGNLWQQEFMKKPIYQELESQIGNKNG